MVDSIARSSHLSTQALDTVLREAGGIQCPEASVDLHEAAHHELLEHAHGLATSVEGAGAMFEGALEGTALGLGPEAISVVAPAVQWLGAIFEGEARNVEYASEKLRGMLAALEGRIGDPECVRDAARSEGFADGIRRAEQLSHQDPRRFAELALGVHRARIDGLETVARGADHGPSFETRYRDEPAFRHGVDRARTSPDATASELARLRSEVTGLEDNLRMLERPRIVRG